MLLWGQIADATQCSAAQHSRIPMLIAIAAYLNSVTRSEPNGFWQPLMALFHCMVQHGTVQYGSLLGGFPLGTVPGTWYFLVPPRPRFQAIYTVTKT